MECESDMATELEKKLALEAKSHELTPLKGGRFRLSQKNEEEIDVSFE
jgi:hypothetical protein